MSNRKRNKRKFTALNLSVSQQYVYPNSRKRMVIVGCIAGLILLSHYTVDALFRKNRFISSGSLTSGHANFETECRSCHEPARNVSAALCSSCHEKTSELTIYDFPAHFRYRSNDPQRTTPEFSAKYEDRVVPCSDCHVEHRGKEADLTRISDNKCLECHQFGSFNKKHPEFDFAIQKVPDDSTLRMTHLRHVAFVLRENKGIESLEDLFQTLKAETMDMHNFFEEACLYCHNPEPSGRNFQPINFERHCARCHIKADAAVFGLPKSDPANPDKPGVETIKQLQQRGGPGLAWIYTINPSQVKEEVGEISKSPIWHKDPWILENLKQIRKRLYPGDGLFDLLAGAGSEPSTRVDSLYSEAIRTLQNQTDELQNRSELKKQVSKINSLLKVARKRLDLPAGDRSETPFIFPFEKPNPNLGEQQRTGFLNLAAALTAANGPECQKCHVIENATFLRVQESQLVLTRAEFNHRAHILERRCTECHTGIPMNEQLITLAVEKPSEFRAQFAKIANADQAATQNIPRLQTCQECHAADKASNSCTTCHKFHPNKMQRLNLQLFVQK